MAVVGQPQTRGYVADARFIGHHEEVAAQRDVAGVGDRRTVHLGDGCGLAERQRLMMSSVLRFMTA
jgi:hypothetical protein